MSTDPEVAAAQFGMLADKVRAFGAPYPGGTLLRESAHTAALACDTCGQLPIDPDTDWLSMAHEAMDHVTETGHVVAIESYRAAIYGPAED